ELNRSAVDFDEPHTNLREDVERLRDHVLAGHRLLEAFYPVGDVRSRPNQLRFGAVGLVPEPLHPIGVVSRAGQPEALRVEETHAVALRGGRNADVVELHGAESYSAAASSLASSFGRNSTSSRSMRGPSTSRTWKRMPSCRTSSPLSAARPSSPKTKPATVW